MIDHTRQTLGPGSLDLQIYNLIAQNEAGPDLAFWWAAVGHSTGSMLLSWV